MSDRIVIAPEAVDALAAELGGLAGELADDAELCRSTAGSLEASIGPGDAGGQAGAAGAAWASLLGLLGERTRAMSATVSAVVAAHRAAEAALAGRLAED